MAVKRLVGGQLETKQEASLERRLRPRAWDEYIGQSRLKENLAVALAAAKKRSESLDHVLLHGPPGLGKTTLAIVIANEMAAQRRDTSGPVLTRPADLISLITSLKPGDILFIDEIHRLNRVVEEILYSAMEDFRLDVVLGKGATADSMRFDLPPFTLIGATTRIGAMAPSLRNRFGIIHRLEFYQKDEIATIIERSAILLGVKINPEAIDFLAARSRFTPRLANRWLRRIRDYAEVHNRGRVELKTAAAGLDLLGIDELGLDRSDRRLLAAIIDKHGGGPVGLTTLAAILGDEPVTIEDHHEPYLLRIGFLERTPQGRKTTPAARDHIRKSRS